TISTGEFPMNQVDPVTESQCRGLLHQHGWADLNQWPLTTERVIALLQEQDYVVALDDLVSFEARGIAAKPKLWTAADVLGLAGMLDARRAWKPAPSKHDSKKTVWQIELERLRAEGRVESM